MKKLLITLLLLFPVHGAWANEILRCEYSSGAFEIDLNKEVINGYQGKIIHEPDDKYVMYFDMETYPGADTYVRRWIIVDRYSGKLTTRLDVRYVSNNKTKGLDLPAQTGECFLKKKKF